MAHLSLAVSEAKKKKESLGTHADTTGIATGMLEGERCIERLGKDTTKMVRNVGCTRT